MNGRLRRALDLGVRRRPVQAALLAMSAVVAVGTVVLLFPAARTGYHAGVAPAGESFGDRALTALFTATSASCAAGLAVVDTGSYWSGFGQVVLLVLMEVGGLGLMIITSLLALLVASRLGLTTRLLADSATGSVDGRTVWRVIRGTVALAGVLEGLLAIGLTLRLWLGHGYPVGRALWFGVFHAVSAFTNTGLTLWPDGLISAGLDGWLLSGLAVAFVMGGIGYPALREVVRVRPARRWSLHTKLTLTGTAGLLLAGVVVVPMIEWDNPATLGTGPVLGRLGEGVFAGMSPRSAGFGSLDYAAAQPSTRLFTDVLMMIGGGSGSTAGGVKITTMAVLVLAVLAEVRGLRDVDVLGRRIGSGTVRQAIAVLGIALTAVGAGVFALFAFSQADLDTVLFEAVSAFSSSGLSTGLTAQLGTAGRLVVVLLMLVGRVGPPAVATALALRQTQRAFRNAEARPVIG